MEYFYIITIVVAITILILILGFIAFTMKLGNNKAIWPPFSEPCPIFWNISGELIDISNAVCIVPFYTGINTGSIYSTGNAFVAGNNYVAGNNFIPTTFTSTPGYKRTETNINNYINFNDIGWNSTGVSSICAKKNWANKYGISWDGVTNFNGC